MLHPDIRREMLEDEVAVAEERLGGRIAALSSTADDVSCRFVSPNGRTYHLRFDARWYDAEPLRLSVVDEQGKALPASEWPPGLCHSQHPVLGVPFACVRGTYEYHAHPSHLPDRWDRYRSRIRLADLLDHLLRKCGR